MRGGVGWYCEGRDGVRVRGGGVRRGWCGSEGVCDVKQPVTDSVAPLHCRTSERPGSTSICSMEKLPFLLLLSYSISAVLPSSVGLCQTHSSPAPPV